MIWSEFFYIRSFFKVNTYAKMFYVSQTICKQLNMHDLHIAFKKG